MNTNKNILPQNFKGFAISATHKSDIESSVIISTCILNKIPYKIVCRVEEVTKDFIPVGDIKFVEKVFYNLTGIEHIKPDYYPEYLKEFLKRKVWNMDKWPLGSRVFIKPSDIYKRFTGFVTNGGYNGKKRGPYICSEIIDIVNEWRYYICDGEVILSSWYKGLDEIYIDIPVPKLDIRFPEGHCSCLDMGTLVNGDFVLIEEQHPFSCGFYGKFNPQDSLLYTRWIASGWNYVLKTCKY